MSKEIKREKRRRHKLCSLKIAFLLDSFQMSKCSGPRPTKVISLNIHDSSCSRFQFNLILKLYLMTDIVIMFLIGNLGGEEPQLTTNPNLPKLDNRLPNEVSKPETVKWNQRVHFQVKQKPNLIESRWIVSKLAISKLRTWSHNLTVGSANVNGPNHRRFMSLKFKLMEKRTRIRVF